MTEPPTLEDRRALMAPHESVTACAQCENHWRLIEAIDAWYWAQLEAHAQLS